MTYAQLAEFRGIGVPGSAGGPSPTGTAVSGTAAFAAAEAFQGDALLSRNVSFYGQDTWRIAQRLTVTYGLRWDIHPPPKGKNLANDPFTLVGLNHPATLTLAPRATPLHPPTYANIAPTGVSA